MEHTELHQKKITILGRLIKESSLTLEEALMLLQEDVQPVFQPSYIPATTTPWITTPYCGSGTAPLTGTGTIAVTDSYGGIGFNTTTTATYSNTPQTLTADLNT